MIRIDAARFFALSAALSAGCSPSPAEPGPSAATTVVVPPEPESSAAEPGPPAPASVQPDAGTEGSELPLVFARK